MPLEGTAWPVRVEWRDRSMREWEYESMRLTNPDRCVVELQTELDSSVEGLLWFLGRIDVSVLLQVK